MQAPFGKAEIEAIIPHRDPFLFLDEVLELELGRRVVARKLLRGDEWFFAGHFPGRPIMPGVLLIEALAQLAGIVVWSGYDLAADSDGDRPPLGVLAGVRKFRFRRLVVPGDLVRLEATCTARMGGVYEFHVVAQVDREIAAEGDLQLGIRS